MKRKMDGIIGLSLALFLAGCAQNGTGQTAPSESEAAGQEAESGQSDTAQAQTEAQSPGFDGQQLSAEDAALFASVKEAAGNEILLFDAADYDGDGVREAFAFAGTESDGILEGQRWFASEDGAKRLETAAGDTEYLQKGSAAVDTQEGTAFWYTESDGGSVTASWLWGVSDGVPFESVLSGKGQDFSGNEDGTFLLYQSDLDAGTDGTGRTVKPCYFYYKDGDFHEYGAQAIGREEYLSLPEASACISSYENDNYWMQDIWLRGNGLVQVNLRNRDRNVTLTCSFKDGALAAESEEDGIAGLLVGELATDVWNGPAGPLLELWEKSCAAEKKDGMFVRIRPDTTAWYDLNGDGQPEEIRYTVLRGEEEDLAEGAEIMIDRKTAFRTDDVVSSDYRLWVADLDRADGQKELLLQGQEDNDIFSMLKFLTLKDGRLEELCDLKEAPVLGGTGNLSRIGLWDFDSGRMLYLPGDKTVGLWADTPVYTQGLGCYYVKLAYICAQDGIQPIAAAQQEFEIRASLLEESPYSYIAAQTIPFYESCAAQTSGDPSFFAELGEELNCLMLTPCTEGSVYAKMRRVSTGEEGWTLFSDAQLFTETPAWG